MHAGASDSESAENDTGTGPATPVSPALSATENRKEDEHQPITLITFRSETDELTRRNLLPADLMPVEEEGSPDVEILKIFRRKIADLRRLPKHQRAREYRAALEWLSATMNALRDKRAYARHRRHMFWQMRCNRPPDMDYR
jgi:hypothetical protein